MNSSILNPEQQRAIALLDAPVIIKAGPGTGKTKTLIARIEYLISQKVDPRDILALTFTKKAAAEMRERIGHIPTMPTITTFHGLAYEILHQSNVQIEIVTEAQRLEFIHVVLERNASVPLKKTDIRDAALKISNYKNATQPEQAQMLSDMPLVEAYNRELAMRSLVDYDDLLILLAQQLRDDTSIKKYLHVLVDELQDTNMLQYELIKGLLKNHHNLFAIGDPHQSIYSFRGADSTIFDRITSDYPNAHAIRLNDNYRSSNQIIKTSAALFPDEPVLVAKQQIIDEVQLVKTLNEFTEADWIVKKISDLAGGIDLLQAGETRGDAALRFSDVAVIYRTHHTARELEKKFSESGIPYQVIGANSPYAQPHLFAITQLLQFALKPTDEVLQALLYSPIFHIPSRVLRIISRIQREEQCSYIKAVRKAIEEASLPKKDQNQFATMVNRIKILTSEIGKLPLTGAITHIQKRLQLDDDSFLKQYLSVAYQFEKKGISAWVAYLAYLENHEFYDPSADTVTLMSMHASKGLEFDTVIVCGFEDGLIPFIKKTENQVVNLDEEKRLLYVAMTRAKRNLYLLSAQSRNKEKNTISRFYDYLKATNIDEVVDEQIALIKKKQKKWVEKKSQLELF